MKIAMDCRFIGKSGIGTYIENILDELVHNHPKNEYLLIADKTFDDYVSFSNIRYVITDIKPFSLKELFLFPVDEINKCDAFFTPYINIPGRIKIPVYSTIHDVIFLDLPELVSKVGLLIRKFFIWRATRISKVIFTRSFFSKERILFHFPHSNEIKIVRNCMSNGIINFNTGDIVKQNYFIFIGNIKAHKGLNTLLKAFEIAQQQGLDSKLVIVGSSEKFRTSDKDVTYLLANLKNVEFTGWVDNNKLFELLSSAKALVLPSRYEGFGIAPLEALYLGTNAIISDIPVLKEVYNSYPVSFFNVDNPESLCSALLQPQESIDLEKIREKINNDFNRRIEDDKLINCIADNSL